MSRFYLTGGTGFIGSHIDKYLTDQGHQVFMLPHPISETIVWLDFTKPFEFIHLSAYGNHYHQKEISKLITANIHDIDFLLRVCQTKMCQKFYNISTSAIQLQNQTLYSLSKNFGELLVDSYKDERFVNVRPYSVYGPGEAAHRFIPAVIRALQSGETIKLDEYAKHDWIFISDFIEAMFAGHTNIGTGISHSNLDIVLMLEEISGKSLKYEQARLRSYDTPGWVCPIGVPHRDIYEGLKQTYEFFARKDN